MTGHIYQREHPEISQDSLCTNTISNINCKNKINWKMMYICLEYTFVRIPYSLKFYESILLLNVPSMNGCAADPNSHISKYWLIQLLDHVKTVKYHFVCTRDSTGEEEINFLIWLSNYCRWWKSTKMIEIVLNWTRKARVRSKPAIQVL